ncbi:MAG: ABC transporter permease [Candidatus Undinarchaeales archaeon]|jgi:putative ABC transport system permease protein|nr:ABC transporter permease [Candidatus Undinarchaeales archaeon]MDP7492425.1 ABC transporter permease [Candidatus Undinarchaeales archaeon]
MDLLSLSLANIGRRLFRNGFTVVSIAIGIAAIVALLALGDGMKESLGDQLGPMAADIIVMPKSKGVQRQRGRFGHGPPGRMRSFGGVYPMDESILSDLRRVDGIKFVVPRYSTRGQLKVASDDFSVSIMGIDPDAEKDYDQIPDFAEGKMFLSRDRNMVVLGDRVVSDFFQFRRPHARSTVVIEGRKFQVAGILEKGGRGGPGGSYDNAVLMSIEDARDISDPEVKDQLSQLVVRATSAEIAENVADDIVKIVDTVQTMALSTMLETIQEIMSTFTAFLAGIAGISLFVAAITILNNMYTAVMERRREIGTMKALGMDSSQVLITFSIEAGILGLLGGALGIAIGLGIGQVVEYMRLGAPGPGDAFLVPVYAPEYMMASVVFGVMVALLSGLYPAYRASQLSPVEALRFE